MRIPVAETSIGYLYPIGAEAFYFVDITTSFYSYCMLSNWLNMLGPITWQDFKKEYKLNYG